MSTISRADLRDEEAQADAERLFAGGGEMGQLMLATDWAATPLGAVSAWPSSLRTMVRVMLDTRYPMAVWWGPGCIHLYNDAYRPILGDKHPHALTDTGARVWAESWNQIGPMAAGVLAGGPATWNENFLFPVNRRGFLEETYFTFSYSPLPDDDGNVSGVLVTTTETTTQVQDERQMRTLRDLASVAASAKDEDVVLKAAAQTLADNPFDFPFALVYIVEDDGRQARLATTAGFDDEARKAMPATIPLDRASKPWPLHRAMQNANPVVIENLFERAGVLPRGACLAPPDTAMLLPLTRPGLATAYGFLVTGINPNRPFNERYMDFLRLTADAITSGIGNARLLEEERRRIEALAEIDRAKTAFFSNVSHEFRTPLTLMLGPVEDLLNGVHGRVVGTQRTQLAMLHRNALRLQKLVNALLDYARTESGRMQARYRPTDIAALTRDAASAFRSVIEHAGLTLVVDCREPECEVYVDADMWEKIVLNLVSNAFKFTFKGRIEVSLRTAGDKVELRVADTGSGIPKHELPHLFERFHRVQGARSRTHEGSGIGLALVQELVRLHGGRITVDSREDAGSVFIVSLPFGAAHLPKEHIDSSTGETGASSAAASFVEEARGWLPENDARLPSPATQQELPRGGANFLRKKQGRILLVEDNADMLDYIRRILEPYWAVETCRDGEKALAAARAQAPDLIVTDVMMPRRDGFGLLHELRSDRRTRGIPVIMLSARAGEEARVEGLQAGAEDYLTKPFSARELLARVNTQIEVGKLRRALREESGKVERVFQDAPMAVAIWRTPQHVYELANRRYLELFGKSNVIGKTVREVFPEPELERRGAWRMFDQVFATGEAHTEARFPAHFYTDNGDLKKALFSFTLAPLRNERQQVDGLMAVVTEVEE